MKKEKKEVKLPKSILAEAKKVNALYGLVEKGDKILVGLSGGKDSIAMVHLLKYYQEKLRMDFEFKPVVIHYGSPEEDEPLENLKKYFAEFGIEVEIFKTNLKELVEKKNNKNKSICSFLARMRRGMLNKKAEEWGANKLALGQHLDDAVETLFMSLIYSGGLRSMPPKYKAENGLEVIRPLIWVREKNMRYFVRKNDIKTIGNEFCFGLKGEKKSHVRAEIKEMLAEIEKKNSYFFDSVKHALQEPDLKSLFILPVKKKYFLRKIFLARLEKKIRKLYNFIKKR